MAEKKRSIDWESIEVDYRSGICTLRQIADKHNITHGAINRRAKRDGWERDLSAKIKAKSEALVSRALVSKKVSKVSKATESDIVNAQAEINAAINLEHHKGVAKSRETFNKLHDEFKSIGNGFDVDKKIVLFQKLVATQETLYTLERRIVKLDDTRPELQGNVNLVINPI